MRRSNLVLLALALPMASLSAQIMIGTRRGPDRPAEKPPQAPGIHDVRLYNRYMFSRFSLESSPMLSYMQTTGALVPGVAHDYFAFGDATLISFRAAPSLFVTSAFTASSLGIPFGMNSSDFGIRVKPWTAPRTSVFADARLSWAYTTDFALPSSAVPIAQIYSTAYTDFRTGRGPGHDPRSRLGDPDYGTLFIHGSAELHALRDARAHHEQRVGLHEQRDATHSRCPVQPWAVARRSLSLST
jgi:hypothetical protein